MKPIITMPANTNANNLQALQVAIACTVAMYARKAMVEMHSPKTASKKAPKARAV